MGDSRQRAWFSMIGLWLAVLSAGCVTSRVAFDTNFARDLMDQGRYVEAEPWIVDALEAAEKASQTNSQPANYMNLGIAASNSGRLYFELGRYAEAEASFWRALSVFRYFSNVPGTSRALRAMGDLGAVYTAQGRYEDAERMLREGLGIVERTGEVDRPAGSFFYVKLGDLYLRQGQYAEAEPLIRRALTIGEQAKNEAAIAFVLDELGRLKRAQGSYIEAEPVIRRALEIRQRMRHPDHPQLADTVSNLADLYATQARYSEAETLYRQALRIREKMLPGDHPDLAASLEHYATLLRKTGREAEAIELETRAKAIWAKRSQ